MSERVVYPFSAIVGQDTLKTALLLNAIDPLIGGVLVRGEKGTAKSTAVRALAALLPEIEVVDGCRFGCNPRDRGSWCPDCRSLSERPSVVRRRPNLVDLPVSATEDRLVGTLDLEHALKHGERRFETGLLAQANRGVLYVDEVNLLDDHLVDTLLDAAAMGVNTVEREGVSFVHPARFVLVGTMNPEEGEVRPQLLDRFGLCVDIQAVRDPDARVEIVRRRRAFDEDSASFGRAWRDSESDLRSQLRVAAESASTIAVSDDMLYTIATICAEMGVDGHRADLTMARAAVALAALESRREATRADVIRVAPLVLAHRTRRKPFEDSSLDEKRLRDALSAAGAGHGAGESQPSDAEAGSGAGCVVPLTAQVAVVGLAGESDPPAPLVLPLDRLRRNNAGRRQESASADQRGRYSRAEPTGQQPSSDIALDATIRAAAPFQLQRQGDMAVKIERSDLHTKVRTRRVGASIVFCVDASGSMGASSRMEAAKQAVLELLVDAYQRRDRVGLVAFRGDRAETVLAPTASVELARLKLRELATGGATPLAAGVLRALELLNAETRRDEAVVPWLVLVTDGRGNVGLTSNSLGSEDARVAALRARNANVNVVVVDAAPAGATTAAKDIARTAGGEYVRLARLDGSAVAGALRERLQAV